MELPGLACVFKSGAVLGSPRNGWNTIHHCASISEKLACYIAVNKEKIARYTK